MSNFFCECPDSGEPPCFGLVQLREQLAAAQSELERVRDKCNEHYMALAAAQEALDAKDARIKELEDAARGLLDALDKYSFASFGEAEDRAREALK